MQASYQQQPQPLPQPSYYNTTHTAAPYAAASSYYAYGAQQAAPVPAIHQPQQQPYAMGYYSAQPQQQPPAYNQQHAYAHQPHMYAPQQPHAPYAQPPPLYSQPLPQQPPQQMQQQQLSPPHAQYPSMPTQPVMLTPQQQQAQQRQRAQQAQQLQQQPQPPQPHTPQPVHHLSSSSSAVLSTSAPSPSAIPKADSSPSLLSVLQDLDSRFLVNCPDEELASFERIMFQLQQAHWFYLDFYSDKYPKLPKLGYKTFCENYFKHIPSFRVHLSKFEQVYASFNAYLNAVPVCGCILVNPERTHVVMVRSWVGNSWGFPRGKLDANEDEITCAIREVDEEIGFDCRSWFKGYELLAPSEGGHAAQLGLSRQTSTSSTASSSSSIQAQQPSFFETQTAKKVTRLFVLLNVPWNTHFETRTRKEISKIAWVPIGALPKASGKPGGNNGGGGGSGPQPPEPTGNPGVDAQNLAQFQAQYPAAAEQAQANAKYKFGNAVGSFGSKLRTFLKKLKSGQITGYGAYETANSEVVQKPQLQQLQQQPTGKKGKGADSNPPSARKTPTPQQSQPLTPASQMAVNTHASIRRHSSAPQKSLSFGEEVRNQETFAASTSNGGGNGNGNNSGWSAEQMFAANARLGVVTTVQEEKLQLPAHLDAKLDAYLGRKTASPQQQQQQQKSGKKAKAAAAAAASPSSPSDANHSTSEPISIPSSGGKSAHSHSHSVSVAPSKSSARAPVAAPELDFGHNPYVSFANLNMHEQGNVLTTATSGPTVATVSEPASAPVEQMTPPPPAKNSGQKAPKQPKENRGRGKQSEKPAEVIPQYRIQKRPASATAEAATSAPPASSFVPAATSTTATPTVAASTTDFKFDLSAIMQPLL